jgi:Uri superfamily endonuclease
MVFLKINYKRANAIQKREIKKTGGLSSGFYMGIGSCVQAASFSKPVVVERTFGFLGKRKNAG